MTLAVVALFAHGPTTLTGIASWRVKETGPHRGDGDGARASSARRSMRATIG